MCYLFSVYWFNVQFGHIPVLFKLNLGYWTWQDEPVANAGHCEGFSGVGTDNDVALNVNKTEASGKDAYDNHQKNGGEKLVTCEVSYFIIMHVRQLFVVGLYIPLCDVFDGYMLFACVMKKSVAWE